MNTERRQFRRFLTDNRAFACLRPDFGRLGKIKDISKGGLAFGYLSSDGLREEPSEIDIFLSGDGFYLPNVPCRVIYDFQIGENFIPTSFLHDRLCGVGFGQLTEGQKSKLQLFLSKYVTGAAQPPE